jgi:DNA replication protein DnaC
VDGAAKFIASVNYVKPPFWLTLTARSGTGKTKLARAVYRQFMDQNRFERFYDPLNNRIGGNTCMFVDWRKFCDDVKGAFDLIDDVCAEWFVILDDLGAERDASGFIASVIDRILNARRGKWTLITTNLKLRQVAEKIDPRVSSRMLRDGNQVVESDALDYNSAERKARRATMTRK